MNSALRQFVERWLANIALFGAIVLATGLLAGVIAAAAGDGAITGQNTTIVHYPHPAHDPPGAVPTVSTPTDDPKAGYLLLYPLLIFFWSTVLLLPVALGGLALAEMASWIGVPQRALRVIALVLAALLSISVLLGNNGGLGALLTLGMLSYAALVRMPKSRRRQAPDMRTSPAHG